MKQQTIDSGDIVEFNGREYKVTFDDDQDMLPPWKEYDGCGIVSDWENRDKLPGERILHSDRNSKLFYDWQATIQKARKEGWGLSDERLEKLTRKLRRAPTQGEITAEAVQYDFYFLRGYCQGDWGYLVICVEDVKTGETDYLGGVESSDFDYPSEAAWEMIRNMDYSRTRAEQGKFASVMAMGI